MGVLQFRQLKLTLRYSNNFHRIPLAHPTQTLYDSNDGNDDDIPISSLAITEPYPINAISVFVYGDNLLSLWLAFN